jgi:hypothetical protein
VQTNATINALTVVKNQFATSEKQTNKIIKAKKVSPALCSNLPLTHLQIIPLRCMLENVNCMSTEAKHSAKIYFKTTKS